jgi:predicted small lipoprotein YifL
VLRDVLHPVSGRDADVKRLSLKAVLVIAAVVSIAGCSRRGDPQGDAAASAAQPRDVAAASSSEGSFPRNWQEARSDLPEHSRGGLFQGREPALPARKRPPPPSFLPAEVAQAPAGPRPPPLTYVGKVTRDGESYAVLGRENRVYMVSVGDAVGNGYQVQSISEKEVVILNSDFGMRQTLPFSAAASNSGPPLNRARPAEDVQPAPPEPQKDD